MEIVFFFSHHRVVSPSNAIIIYLADCSNLHLHRRIPSPHHQSILASLEYHRHKIVLYYYTRILYNIIVYHYARVSSDSAFVRSVTPNKGCEITVFFFSISTARRSYNI